MIMTKRYLGAALCADDLHAQLAPVARRSEKGETRLETNETDLPWTARGA